MLSMINEDMIAEEDTPENREQAYYDMALFTGTFIIYFFNLDMKLTAAMEPWLLKHYDRIERDTHL